MILYGLKDLSFVATRYCSITEGGDMLISGDGI